ncbi:MAG TPA: hypothetical protein PKY30_02050 [Myxococcota bacterium]|nr:hypothetical protein [Myxococcota bacterium]HND31203.1 hypothetical protein [Myxococcota bacterium]HNH45786.1 hypothetical protein [Myxococcota bacterium]
MIFLLLACTAGKDTGADTELGKIVADRAGETAAVNVPVAFGYHFGGKALFFFGGNPSGTCEDAAEYLKSSIFDPSDLLAAGTCQASILMNYDGAEVSYEDDLANVTLSLGCAMDSGSWVFETRDDEDYYYSGSWWQGHPDSFSITAGPGEGQDYVISMDMDQYTGNFIYEELEAAPATGTVSGSFSATFCEDLKYADIFAL